MAQGRLAAAMDPPHITEFASERYFEKLNQLNASQQQKQQRQSPDAADPASRSYTSSSSPSSAFVLPLRDLRHADPETSRSSDQKRERSRFLHFRHRVPRLSSKPLMPSSENASLLPPQAQTSSAALPRSCPSLDRLVLALPNELQLHILSFLSVGDVINFRLTSRSWYALIAQNEAPIARNLLERHVPAYARRLYPVTDPAKATLHHLLCLWHRLHVAAKLAFLMCEWITKEIFLRQSDAQRAAFAPQHERMRCRLLPLLFTVFHFFETYRRLQLEYIAKHDGHGLQKQPYTVNPIEVEILSMYDDQTLLRLHEVFPLIISSFCRRLRPPTYVGRVERSLRGYLRERPADDVHSAILCIGGLRQVERIWEIRGYNARRAAVDIWHQGLVREPEVEVPVKFRLGLKAFSRKKTVSLSTTMTEAYHAIGETKKRGAPGAPVKPEYPSSLVVGSERSPLASGAPMSQLSSDKAQSLLGDLPALQHIWMATAEAMILDRGIVRRPQDIKRNQQVMLDLIREGAADEKDDWWCGRQVVESMRSTAAAADDDND